jgi:ribosomal protein S19E (S16A)
VRYLVGQGLLKTVEGDADDEEKDEHDPAVGAVAQVVARLLKKLGLVLPEDEKRALTLGGSATTRSSATRCAGEGGKMGG